MSAGFDFTVFLTSFHNTEPAYMCSVLFLLSDVRARLGASSASVVTASSASRPIAVARPQIKQQSVRPRTAGVFGRLGSAK